MQEKYKRVPIEAIDDRPSILLLASVPKVKTDWPPMAPRQRIDHNAVLGADVQPENFSAALLALLQRTFPDYRVVCASDRDVTPQILATAKASAAPERGAVGTQVVVFHSDALPFELDACDWSAGVIAKTGRKTGIHFGDEATWAWSDRIMSLRVMWRCMVATRGIRAAFVIGGTEEEAEVAWAAASATDSTIPIFAVGSTGGAARYLSLRGNLHLGFGSWWSPEASAYDRLAYDRAYEALFAEIFAALDG